MSIINDALKKTQANLNKTDPDQTPEKKQDAPNNQNPVNIYEKLHKTQSDQKNPNQAKETPDKERPTPQSLKKWFKTSLIIVFCISLASVGLVLLSRYTPVRIFVNTIKQKGISSKRHISRRARKRRTYAAGELILSGTSLIDGKRVALINEEIYEVGDIINGKKITSINLNRVEF